MKEYGEVTYLRPAADGSVTPGATRNAEYVLRKLYECTRDLHPEYGLKGWTEQHLVYGPGWNESHTGVGDSTFVQGFGTELVTEDWAAGPGLPIAWYECVEESVGV